MSEALETGVSFVPYVPASGAFKRGLTGGRTTYTQPYTHSEYLHIKYIVHTDTSVGKHTPLGSPSHLASASLFFVCALVSGGVFLLERLESDTLVPPLTPLAQPMSDDEDERLPTFEEPLVLRRRLRREAREREAAAHPCVGKLLANLVDVMVLDDPKVT